jgi:hypothetical protein
MRFVTVYDFDSKTKKAIPLAELAPNMVRGRLPDGSVVWVDGTKLKPSTTPIRPPFDERRRQILRQLKEDLDEVYPNTLAQWEEDLRCDLHADREIRIWRWIAYQYKRLTRSGQASQARKKDFFQLLLKWTLNKNVDAVLATVDLGELTRDDAKQLLQCFWATNSEFFGGRIAEWFPALPVVDFATIHSLDEFKARVAPVSVIFAVDWKSGDNFNVVFGTEVLEAGSQSEQAQSFKMMAFAVDFASEQVEHLCAMVEIAKGRYEWKQDPPPDPTGTGKTRERLW